MATGEINDRQRTPHPPLHWCDPRRTDSTMGGTPCEQDPTEDKIVTEKKESGAIITTPPPSPKYPLCCRRNGNADCQYMIWTSVDSPTYCTRALHSAAGEAEKVLDIQIRFEGMKAENRMRELRGESPAYIEIHFDGLLTELREQGER